MKLSELILTVDKSQDNQAYCDLTNYSWSEDLDKRFAGYHTLEA